MVTENVVTEKVVTDTTGLYDYELVAIFKPDMGDPELDAAVDKVGRFITTHDGIIDSTDRWGKRRLAYPIKRFGEGNYVLFKFKFKQTLGKELESSLAITDEVLRHLLVRVDE